MWLLTCPLLKINLQVHGEVLDQHTKIHLFPSFVGPTHTNTLNMTSSSNSTYHIYGIIAVKWRYITRKQNISWKCWYLSKFVLKPSVMDKPVLNLKKTVTIVLFFIYNEDYSHRIMIKNWAENALIPPSPFLIGSSDKYETEVHVTLLPISIEAFPLNSSLRHSTLSVRQQ